jgi:hypothetical protein
LDPFTPTDGIERWTDDIDEEVSVLATDAADFGGGSLFRKMDPNGLSRSKSEPMC